MSTGKSFTAAEQRAILLATIQHLLHCAPASIHRNQKRLRKDLDQRLGKRSKRIRTGDYLFFDFLEGFTKTSKLGHAVDEACRVLGKD